MNWNMCMAGAANGLPERLEELRIARGIKSMRAFAIRCGLPQTPTFKYFKGTGVPGIVSLQKIAAVLHVSLDWLVKGEGPMDYLPVGHVTPEGHEVAQGPTIAFSGAPTKELIEQLASQPDIPDPPKETPLFAILDMKRMATAIDIGEEVFATRKQRPSSFRRAQVFVALYDSLGRATPTTLRTLVHLWDMEDLPQDEAT